MSNVTPRPAAPFTPTTSSDDPPCCGGPSPIAGACCVRDADAKAAGRAGCECAPGACECGTSLAADAAATGATSCC